MDRCKLKQELSDELCAYCPWNKGEIEHLADSLCEGTYCDDAMDSFIEDNENYFDDSDNG